MANDRAAIVARARSAIGARFRPQGRMIERGLDCIGVVATAIGIEPDQAPDDYRLGDGDPDAAGTAFRSCGFTRLPENEAEPGDVLLVRIASTQLHAVVLTRGGHIHAHAGLRRVVETPGAVPWPVVSAWRFATRGN